MFPTLALVLRYSSHQMEVVRVVRSAFMHNQYHFHKLKPPLQKEHLCLPLNKDGGTPVAPARLQESPSGGGRGSKGPPSPARLLPTGWKPAAASRPGATAPGQAMPAPATCWQPLLLPAGERRGRPSALFGRATGSDPSPKAPLPSPVP